MPRFLADSEHAGTLDGSISFHGMATNTLAVSGWFKLFARSSNPDLKLMIYHVTFERDAKVYTLHGEKHVRRGPVFRAWSDTTTLRCRLHAGGDDTAPLIGTGVLRLRLANFASQLFSFRARNGRTMAAKAGALASFFAFFARELLDSYGRLRRT